jgi:hypothetical protein
LAVDSLGIDRADLEPLMRIERTLHRWSERECNGEVEVADDGKAFAVSGSFRVALCDKLGTKVEHRWAIPNRERGALKRLAAIMARYPKLAAYYQGDPRGCALYVYEKGKLREYQKRVGLEHAGRFAINSCYSSVGVAVCL